jgi:hypothetical protein
MNKTRKNKRHSVTRGWKKEKPGYHQKTIMLKKCGKKCFLGPNKSFPICKKNTCKVSSKGVHSAYTRARQYHKTKIANKAKKLIAKMNL